MQAVRTECERAGTASPKEGLKDPTRSKLLKLHYERYSEKIKSYLLNRIEAQEEQKGDFTWKVGLTRIDYPIPRIDQPLTIHVSPLSYWTALNFNRQILGNPDSPELQSLREESLAEIISAKDEVTFSCPSQLHIAFSIITNDGKLLIVWKDENLSALARRGYGWSCTIEEGLLWNEDVRDSQLDF